MNSFTHSSILEILGLHCPLLQVCDTELTKVATATQTETFTKGCPCPNLKEVHLEVPSLKIFHKLLHILGSKNPTLEKLSVWIDENKYDYANHNHKDAILTSDQCQSLQCLSNGCPLLKKSILALVSYHHYPHLPSVI